MEYSKQGSGTIKNLESCLSELEYVYDIESNGLTISEVILFLKISNVHYDLSKLVFNDNHSLKNIVALVLNETKYSGEIDSERESLISNNGVQGSDTIYLFYLFDFLKLKKHVSKRFYHYMIFKLVSCMNLFDTGFPDSDYLYNEYFYQEEDYISSGEVDRKDRADFYKMKTIYNTIIFHYETYCKELSFEKGYDDSFSDLEKALIIDFNFIIKNIECGIDLVESEFDLQIGDEDGFGLYEDRVMDYDGPEMLIHESYMCRFAYCSTPEDWVENMYIESVNNHSNECYLVTGLNNPLEMFLNGKKDNPLQEDAKNFIQLSDIIFEKIPNTIKLICNQ